MEKVSKEEYEHNKAIYDMALTYDDKFSADGLFLFIAAKLGRLRNHFESDEFIGYTGSDKHHTQIAEAHALALKVQEMILGGTYPEQSEISRLFDLLKDSPLWWD